VLDFWEGVYIYTFGWIMKVALRSTNIAMENPPFEDVFPIGKGEFPLPC